MAPNESERILAAISDSEGRMRSDLGEVRGEVKELRGEIAGTKGEVISLRGEVRGHQSNCELKHSAVDANFTHLGGRVSKIETNGAAHDEEEAEALKAEIQRRDAEKRKWTFWIVTTFLVAALTSGASTAALGGLFSKKKPEEARLPQPMPTIIIAMPEGSHAAPTVSAPYPRAPASGKETVAEPY